MQGIFHRFFIVVMILIGMASFPSVSHAAEGSRVLLALSKVDHKLVIVDPQTFKILGSAPVGEDPHEVVTSADGKTAYVSNTGSGRFHEINVIDIVNKKALPSIDTGAMLGPHGMQFVNGKLWFTSEGAKSIGRIDPKEGKVDLILGVGQNRTHMLVVAPNEKQVYMTNVDSGTVSIYENLMLPPPIPPIGKPLATAKPQMGWLQTVLPAGKGSEGIAVTTDGKEIWTADAHAATITIIDIVAKKVKETVDTKVLGISRVAFTPDGKLALISSLRTGDLLIYDVKIRKEIKKLHLGVGAAHILIEPGGARAFVSCTPAHYVKVIDLKKLEVAGEFKIGDRPDGMTWGNLENR
jgi:DNA-binding beta-propeller fold protein YncE